MGKREIYTVNSKLKHDNGEIEIVATKKIALEKINGKWVSTIIHEERFISITIFCSRIVSIRDVF